MQVHTEALLEPGFHPSPLTGMPQSPRSTSWTAEFVLLAAIWGASFLFTRIVSVELGAFPTAWLRVTIAVAFLLPILLARGLWPALRAHGKAILFVGTINSGFPFALYAFAVLHITTGLAAILNATVPLFGGLVAWLWLSEKLSASRIVGLCLGFVGIVLLAWDQAGVKAGATGMDALWAVLACLLATLCYAVAASFTKRYLVGVPALAAATGSQIGASLALLLPALWSWPAVWPSDSAVASVVVVGVLCTGVAYLLYFRLIENAGASKAVTVTFMIPVFALIYGVAFLSEPVTPRMVLCALVVLLGTALATGLLQQAWRSRSNKGSNKTSGV